MQEHCRRHNHCATKVVDSQTRDSVMAFITVKFGDNEEELFNPHCATVNLLDNIRRRCRCQKGITLDLSDEDGEIKNLHDFPTHYAHKFLKGREVFVLIKVEKGQGDQPTTYSALLNDLELNNPKLLARLEALSKSSNETPKSGQRKESLWNAANFKIRKLRGGGGGGGVGGNTSAGRNRPDTLSQSRAETKNIGNTPSPPGKGKPRKGSFK